MADNFRFKNFPVYQKAQELYKFIIEITDESKEHYVRDQIRRAAFSVILNIAEGSAKKSDKDFARYLQNALGSVSEVYAAADTMRFMEMISDPQFQKIEAVMLEVSKQLGGLHKTLVNS